MPERSEIQLIEAASGGDIESFGELCRRYYAAMVAVGYCVLGEHYLAEDAAQESFARALVNLRNLKNKDRFAPWLAAICRNVARDMLAKEVRQKSNEDFSQAAGQGDSKEDEKLIRLAIGKLPEPAKELVVLRYYDGLSYEQIGSVLGISPAAINGRLTRAKKKMADYLRCNGFPENRL
ncbi:MAG: sigma-70 family RNA polymerase sigma factor [Sedimentisphaerales bacterium]|nr:sigma-70 family RNA polymerase sigma factor [Sedimentisphaerales bacterium]